MDFVTAVKTVLIEKYCCLSGRARRSEYWWWTLAVMIVNSILGALGATDPNSAMSKVSMVVSLAIFLPGLGVSVRRLHDVGKSGWNLLWLLLPIIGWIILLISYVKDSDIGDNQYGPNPKSSSNE